MTRKIFHDLQGVVGGEDKGERRAVHDSPRVKVTAHARQVKKHPLPEKEEVTG